MLRRLLKEVMREILMACAKTSSILPVCEKQPTNHGWFSLCSDTKIHLCAHCESFLCRCYLTNFSTGLEQPRSVYAHASGMMQGSFSLMPEIGLEEDATVAVVEVTELSCSAD